ncbi:MAG: hypothetical protein IJ184_05910 [Alphaproteobacteria bacterium]|nr:hypothetical protein [Alphaproteobacteria bacterium]
MIKNNFIVAGLGLVLTLLSANVGALDEKTKAAVGLSKDDAKDLCNGRGPLGELYLPKEMVIRCGLCLDGKAELTLDCVKRLAYDYNARRQLYGDERQQIMGEFTRDNIIFAVNNMSAAGKHEDKANNEAGYGSMPALGADGQPDPDNVLEKSSAETCMDEQNSSRCLMEANNTLTADSTELLLKALKSKAMINRSDFVSTLFNEVILNEKVDDKDKELIKPARK